MHSTHVMNNGIPFAIALIFLCLAIAAGGMLFAPQTAFRTRRKPRWVGLCLLLLKKLYSGRLANRHQK